MGNHTGEWCVASGNGYRVAAAWIGRRAEAVGGFSADVTTTRSETEEAPLDDGNDGEIDFVGESESDRVRSSATVAVTAVAVTVTVAMSPVSSHLTSNSAVPRGCAVRVVAVVAMAGSSPVGCRV